MPLFLLGGMGAGDVKLLAALGAWLGPGDAFWLAIYASMAGGVIAVVDRRCATAISARRFKNIGNARSVLVVCRPAAACRR